MAKTVNQRLRNVDQLIADRVSRRRLGDLSGRVFWRRKGINPDTLNLYEWAEVPIFGFLDNGYTQEAGSGTDFVPEQQERTLDVRVNRDWWDTHGTSAIDYQYELSFADGGDRVPCSFRNASVRDPDTFAAVTFVEIRDAA